MYFWIPIYFALTAIFSVITPLAYFFFTKKGSQFLKNSLNPYFPKKMIEEVVAEKVEKALSDCEVEELIDKKLEVLVIVFKQKIPMAATFLVGGLLEKLKSSAKIELLKIAPELKEHCKENFLEKYKFDDAFYFLKDQIPKKVYYSFLFRIGLFYGALGFMFGLIQLLILWLLA